MSAMLPALQLLCLVPVLWWLELHCILQAAATTVCTSLGADLDRVVLQGNLSEFVKKKPEARSYYELKSAQGLKFILPEPGFLEGIKTKDRPILKMMKVAYK